MRTATFVRGWRSPSGTDAFIYKLDPIYVDPATMMTHQYVAILRHGVHPADMYPTVPTGLKHNHVTPDYSRGRIGTCASGLNKVQGVLASIGVTHIQAEGLHGTYRKEIES
jgi:hypothetical protein